MRTILLLILVSLPVQAIVLDPNNPVEAPFSVTAFDPLDNPVTRLSVSLNFASEGAMDDGESVTLRVLNSSGVQVGEKTCTNTLGVPLLAADCLTTDLDNSIVTSALKIVLEGVGAMDIEGAALVAASAGTHRQGGALSLVPSDFGNSAYGIVYTRSPVISDGWGAGQDSSATQFASEVQRINGGFTESDVVYNDLNGNEYVVFDCTTVTPMICSAGEARVSPDGTMIAFSVLYGRALSGVGQNMDKLTHGEIWLWDVTTPEVPAYKMPNSLPSSWKVIDRAPDWINNNELVIISNRAKKQLIKNFAIQYTFNNQRGQNLQGAAPYGVSMEAEQYLGYGTDAAVRASAYSLQLYRINIDGTNAQNLTPHEYMVLRPTVLKNGDILYSSWQFHADKGKTKKGLTLAESDTQSNKWWLSRVNQNGGDHTVLLGAHKHDLSFTLITAGYLPSHITGGEQTDALRANRSVAEGHDGKLYISNYYRGNHRGNGIIYSMTPYADPSIEGCLTRNCVLYKVGAASAVAGTGTFLPKDFQAFTPYGNAQDNHPRRYDDPSTSGVNERKPVGKAGWYSLLPDDRVTITHSRGHCYAPFAVSGATVIDPSHPFFGELVNGPVYLVGEPACDSGIWETLAPMVTDPFNEDQMVPLIDSPLYHEWDSDAVATFDSLYGQEMPTQQSAYTPGNCYLHVVDATESEHAQYNGYTYDFNQQNGIRCAAQGCSMRTDDADFHANNIAGLKILKHEIWTSGWFTDPTVTNALPVASRADVFAGTMSTLGWMKTTDLGTQPLEADGSVNVRVPCDTPITFHASDANGIIITSDHMAQSLRPGETRTCHGCHARHSEEAYALGGGVTALSRWADTDAAGTTPALLNGTESLWFDDDIAPILESRCQSCHAEFDTSDPYLYTKVAQDYRQIGFNFLERHVSGVVANTSVEHIRIKDGGSGYLVGETLDLTGEGNGNATASISAVDGSGSITGISITNGGTTYPDLFAVSVNTAGGSGADLVGQTQTAFLPRLQSSKLVSRFARESLLYWACMGSRQDGRSNALYNNDIDFDVPDHPDAGDVGYATVNECLTIARWIDQGAYGYKDPNPGNGLDVHP